ncbi:SDR family oxidoreductase [Novosphingobium album (ex Liu et al. 2023)]|uniref:SDR family NAD(P)-dependent oxidoreductase n=1 Tax=Novosphingobium album (ex Liu et al. 2023) TaxID=3031130 RepID=A0ABT5WU98_9SPHN|nr:SDR family oxidoreductase [Novosphingobium album (ex Liu et al. 2023)]MDE8653476.1 SDR family NAD(P)-dependent oxidoreductase [Novosphingobium album (ex Liu et al. 2023)]
MGRTIVITGAGVGLGRALARRFASEGETVILLGRTFSKVDALAKELGEPHFAVECDVASPDSVRAAFATIGERHPTIDVLINNAAIFEPFTIAEARDDQIQSILAINLAGPIYCCRSAIPMMRAGGCIINVGSESVVQPFAMLSLYQCSKAGLEKLTENLSRELDSAGIRVCLIRAGQMFEEGKQTGWDPEVAMRFAQGSAMNGLNLRERPISHVNSVTDAFRTVIDCSPDVRITHVSIEARRP